MTPATLIPQQRGGRATARELAQADAWRAQIQAPKAPARNWFYTLDSLARAELLSQAEHGLSAYGPARVYPAKLESPAHTSLLDQRNNEMLRLLRSSLRPAQPKPVPRVKHKALHLTRKQQAVIRASRVHASSTQERLEGCDRFRLTRQWTGTVVTVDPASFDAVAVTTDQRGRGDQHELTIPLSLVRPPDRALVVPGGLFYFCVGDYIKNGNATPGSLVWFRRRALSRLSVADLLHSAAAHVATMTCR